MCACERVSAKHTGGFKHLSSISHRFLHFKPKGGGGGGGGGTKKCIQDLHTNCVPAAKVTLACRISCSDDKRWNMKKGRGWKGGGGGGRAWNVVGALLLPTKVICTSGH